ncbi:MAG: electron transfer flavoprotein subunit beta/FixA family protein, partial [bacterium]
MRFVVCVKEVPDTTEIRIDPETNTLIREGVPAIINPFDMYAVEMALEARESYGGEVIVVSMGPPKVENNLRNLLAMGVDKA